MTVAAWRARRAGSPGGGLPLVVVLACLCQLGLGLAWSVLQPPYQGLDEPQHEAGVLQLVYHHTWPDPLNLVMPVGLVRAQYLDPVPHRGKASPTPTPRSSRPSLAAEGGDATFSGYSQMAQHPPLAYAVDAAVIRALPFTQSWAHDQELAVMRWVSATLLLPLPALAWAAMKRFSRDRHLQAAAALSPLLVPGIARAGGSVSNDALLIVLTAAVGLCVSRILTGDRSVRTGVVAGVFAMLDLLTKGTALVVPLWLVLAYAWAWWRGRGEPLAPLGRSAAWCAGLTGVGLVWWVRNVVQFHAVQPSGGRAPTGPLNASGDAGRFVHLFFPQVSFSFWGALGLPSPPALDRGITIAATLTVLALVVLGLGGRRIVPLLILSSVFVGILGIVAVGSLTHYLSYDVLAGAQGRYLYPAVTSLSVPALLGAGVLARGRLRPLVPVTTLVVAVLMQRAGALAALHTTWDPIGRGWRGGLQVLLRWAPFGGAVTMTMLVSVLVLAVALAVAVLAHAVLGRHAAGHSGQAVTRPLAAGKGH